MPKTRKITLKVRGASATEVAERLRERTRLAVTPSFASPLNRGGDKPLAGRVDEDGCTVTLNERVFARGVEPVVRARFTEGPEGVTIEGEAGLAPVVVWLLRLNYLFAMLVTVGVGVATVSAGEPAWISAVFAVMVLAATGAVGWNVSRAEERVPELEARLQKALLEPPVPQSLESTSETEVEPEDERKRRAARAKQGLS